MQKPRLLIEEWLPAAAIGVECMRERGSASALAPTTYLHVWWARRPLTAARAAVLASVLPADFPRDVFERLWRSVKYEEVYLKDYEDVRAARRGLRDYFHFYNTERYHQALEYRTPQSVHWGGS
jgi:adenine-specific DNA methylase